MTSGTTAVELETLTDPGDVRAAGDIFRTAMVGVPPLPADADGLVEPGRTLGARLDGQLVGAADAYTSWLVVAGGERVPHAAVTHVGVLPTHTRRGVVSALLRRQLADIAERGEVVASLRATQGGIYERFGYGVAGSYATLELDRRHARLRDTVAPGGPVRYPDPRNRWETLAKIYAAADISWTGAIDRPPYWWRFQELVAGSGGWTVVHGEPGAEDGFLRYRAAEGTGWPRNPQRTAVVDDWVAATPAAYCGLLRHLLTHDIVDRIVVTFAPVDSPLRHMFADERVVTVAGVHDETWLRLVDVLTALARRTYREARPVVLAVTDDVLPANSGSYRIAADAVTRVGAPADLSTDVATLAAVYLGGSTWRQLALAGRVTENRSGAVDAADALFATTAAPFAGTYF
ncbi:GNAT family N-acetyltransferase [Nocardia sp. BSTN01]|uniref:GNAT family N-acetyltransferase n=1 Tax=Nocardia sp. BSTN01 TaxID=2783665 RepID=UPI0018906745|nr:GNAT family N-acetyltransferase [Nocardia sp. BSTN01]MBF4999448.1 GNAT family N-acetyltransferase [Nocardia sp. BSTN01]